MSEWQPIETAPKDGRVILAVSTYHTTTGKFLGWDVWSDDMSNDHMDENIYSGWRIADATLWMLPPPEPTP